MICTSEVPLLHPLPLNCVSPPLSNLKTLLGIQSFLSLGGWELFLQLNLMNARILDIALLVAQERICVPELGLKHFSLNILGVAMSVKELIEAILEVCVDMRHPRSDVPVRELILVSWFLHLKFVVEEIPET